MQRYCGIIASLSVLWQAHARLAPMLSFLGAPRSAQPSTPNDAANATECPSCEDDAATCPICLEPCEHKQRTLDCGHIFCEACICKYADGMRHGVSRLTFPCPCCREEVPIWQQRNITEAAIAWPGEVSARPAIQNVDSIASERPVWTSNNVRRECTRPALAHQGNPRFLRAEQARQAPWWSRRTSQSEQERRDLARAAGRVVLRYCPGCSTPIMKNGGCNSMSCPCGRRFKWMDARPVRPCRHCHISADEGNWLNPGRWKTCAFCAPRARREAKALQAASFAAAMPVGAVIGAAMLSAVSTWIAACTAVALVPAAVFGPPALAYEPVRRACGFKKNYLGRAAASGAGVAVIGTAMVLSGYDSD